MAKEHGSNQCTLESLEDQPVPSRGSPDQMPVIVDSSTISTTPVENRVEPLPTTPNEKTGSGIASAFVHSDSGLPTPPPSDSEAVRGRQRPAEFKKPSSTGQTQRSRSVASATDLRQSRPSISRIQTDVSDITQAQTSARRAPSPYAYTPEAGTFKIDAVPKPKKIELAPALKTTSSPASDSKYHKNNRYSREYDSSTDSEYKPKKSLRFAESHRGPADTSPNDSKSSADSGSSHRRVHEHQSSYRHGESAVSGQKADGVENGGENAPRREHRSSSRPSRSSSKVRDSPNTSSAEDRSISDVRSTRKSGSDSHSVQRRTSHRHERPRPDEIFSQPSHGHHKLSNLEDDATRHVYRVSRSGHPMTPPAVTTPHPMEDYFSRAFQDNALKKSRYVPRLSTDETAIYSPPTSPPRTPRSERLPRQEYFESPASSPRGTPRHSRTPSVDEAQLKELKDLKPHTASLLSQATTTAAAIAITKTSPPLSRSTTNAIEATFACSNNVVPSKPRSRASSPQRDRLQRADIYTYGDQVMPQVTYPPVPQSKRPSTRDGFPLHAAPHHPQRTASWAGHDAQYTSHGSHYGGAGHTMTALSNVQSVQAPITPALQRTQSMSGPQEFLLRLDEFTLPPCPRSSPTNGLRDWSTFKDFAEASICPKCTHALSLTRFRSQLMKGRDKPYDRYTTCALSRPWIRIAVVESVKLNRSDLSLVKKASMLPEGARACEGNRPDVRTWWKLIDPTTERAVPDFFACSACVGSVHQVFPDLPDLFKRDVLNQEKVCGLREDSKEFQILTDQLAQIAVKCRDRGKSSARYMQPFVDQVRRSTRYAECKRDTLSPSLAWHFAPDLPEFTVCERCYHEVVFPVEDKPFARNISKVLVRVPLLDTKGPVVNLVTPKGTSDIGTQLTSCQLYSERMRKLFNDMITGKISYDFFRTKVKERHEWQYRLTEMNRFHEEAQRMGWDSGVDINKNKAIWRSLE